MIITLLLTATSVYMPTKKLTKKNRTLDQYVCGFLAPLSPLVSVKSHDVDHYHPLKEICVVDLAIRLHKILHDNYDTYDNDDTTFLEYICVSR